MGRARGSATWADDVGQPRESRAPPPGYPGRDTSRYGVAMRSSVAVSRAVPRVRAVLVCVALVAFAAIASADVVVLKDGRRIEGSVVSEANGIVKVQTSFGEQTFKASDVAAIERSKTRSQELSDRWRAAKTAEDFFQLGKWAEERKLAADAKKCFVRAIEVDATHAGAHTALGHVLYKGEWLTPAERELRMARDLEAEMTARGLVRWRDQWVTPEEKEHFEKNEVLVDGKWIPFEAAQRAQGLELCGTEWLPRAEAHARNDVRATAEVAKVEFALALGPDAIVAGTASQTVVDQIGAGLVTGRAWFDGVYAPPRGLELFAGRRAELYVFLANEPYLATVPHLAALSPTLPQGWGDAVARAHGLFFIDPWPVSSVRKWFRPEADVVGHSYHHWGHLLVARLGYDGRLLPPWYEEGIAALLEFRVHQRNTVFCRGRASTETASGPSTGEPGGKAPPATKTKRGAVPPPATGPDFDPKTLAAGEWRAALKKNLAAGTVVDFDHLATREFTQLESADIATAMAIVEWLEEQKALRAFHDALRKAAPLAPLRVLENPYERMACYEHAFQSAVKLSTKQADEAWRQWFLSR